MSKMLNVFEIIWRILGEGPSFTNLQIIDHNLPTFLFILTLQRQAGWASWGRGSSLFNY